jgi:DNA ligase (NAD+)
MAIEGFAKISSTDIVGGLTKKWPTIKHMLSLGFNLSDTPLFQESEVIKSPIVGMRVVFTGKMIQGSRNQMKKYALELGAKVQSSVSVKTDILICGEKVGQAKVSKAEKLGIKIMSEEEYLILLQDQ